MKYIDILYYALDSAKAHVKRLEESSGPRSLRALPRAREDVVFLEGAIAAELEG